jgi:nucleoprotein TPR
MAAAVDSSYLAAHLSIPESSITALLDAPTSELVKSFLESVQAKAIEFDAVNADKLRAEVELETIIRSTDSRNRLHKESQDKQLKEIDELRKKLADEGM